MKRRTLLKAGLGLSMAGLFVDQYDERHGPHPVGMASCPEATEDTAVFTVSDPSHVRLLQFTDLHFYQKPWRKDLDGRTRDDMRRLVDLYAPDLLLITGDLWNNNPMHCGGYYLEQCLEMVVALGRPWLFVWGNHDRLDDYPAGHRALAAAPGSLYRGGKSAGCYRVFLRDRQGRSLWDLICINTNGYGLGPAQQKWLTTFATTTPHAFAVFHIPLLQQGQLWDRGQGRGVKLEPTGSGVENGATAKQLLTHNVRAGIHGHDHLNDYSLVAEGIEFIYGRATGYSGYGGDRVPKGGKLYELNTENAKFAWRTVLADGSSWTPRGHCENWRADLWS
ncbi:MAG: metallophosphoesterase [Vulcanimicrobiota bacterium]